MSNLLEDFPRVLRFPPSSKCLHVVGLNGLAWRVSVRVRPQNRDTVKSQGVFRVLGLKTKWSKVELFFFFFFVISSQAPHVQERRWSDWINRSGAEIWNERLVQFPFTYLTNCLENLHAKIGAVVRVLAFHQCGLGSIHASTPCVGWDCWFWNFLREAVLQAPVVQRQEALSTG